MWGSRGLPLNSSGNTGILDSQPINLIIFLILFLLLQCLGICQGTHTVRGPKSTSFPCAMTSLSVLVSKKATISMLGQFLRWGITTSPLSVSSMAQDVTYHAIAKVKELKRPSSQLISMGLAMQHHSPACDICGGHFRHHGPLAWACNGNATLTAFVSLFVNICFHCGT